MLHWRDFENYPMDQKIKALFECGTFIMGIRYYGYKVNLYLLNGFYLEVFYNHKQDLIEKIVPLDVSHKRIKFYTDQIKLPALP